MQPRGGEAAQIENCDTFRKVPRCHPRPLRCSRGSRQLGACTPLPTECHRGRAGVHRAEQRRESTARRGSRTETVLTWRHRACKPGCELAARFASTRTRPRARSRHQGGKSGCAKPSMTMSDHLCSCSLVLVHAVDVPELAEDLPAGCWLVSGRTSTLQRSSQPCSQLVRLSSAFSGHFYSVAEL